MNYIFILLFSLFTADLFAQSCSGFPAVPTMIPCSSAASSLSNGANINGGGTYSYCGSGNPTYSGINLSGGSIYICGNTTLSGGNFNSGTIFVACGATLTFANNVSFSGNLGIVNYGTVQVNGNLTFQNGGCYLYNEGYSAKANITGNFNFPGNQIAGYIRNSGKITVGGTLNLGAGGKVCAASASVITVGSLSTGSSNCNSSDAANNNFMFSGNATQQTIFRYSGTASLKGLFTNSANVIVQRVGSAPTLPCSNITSGWGSATVLTAAIPSLPAEPTQLGCLVNGNVNCSSNVALPVELTFFDVACENNKAVLKWATASERNNEYWTIERSRDLVNIEKIERISGAGNSTQLLKYSFEDPNTLGELVYYRITQHDYDGKSKTFDWKSIECGLSGDFNVFPNPSTGNFRVTTTMQLNEETAYYVTDRSGKVIASGVATLAPGTPFDLDLGQYEPGMYFLKVTSGEASWAARLIKR